VWFSGGRRRCRAQADNAAYLRGRVYGFAFAEDFDLALAREPDRGLAHRGHVALPFFTEQPGYIGGADGFIRAACGGEAEYVTFDIVQNADSVR
jgi:hypothetical protein